MFVHNFLFMVDKICNKQTAHYTNTLEIYRGL